MKISDELCDHYQNDMDEKIAKSEEDWETEFEKQKLEFDGKVAAVQKEQWTQCQEAIERVTLDAEDQLKSMKHAHNCETTELKRRIQQLLEQQTLSEIKEQEFDEEKCQKEEEHIVKIKTMEKQLSGERDEVEAQINVAKNEMNALKENHEREMENSKTELEKKYSNVLSEAKNEMKAKYQAELDEKVQRVQSHLRQQYEQDLDKNKEELHESSITLKTKFEKELAEAVAQLEELHERNQQHEFEKTKLKKDFENAKKNMEKLHEEVEKKKNIQIQQFEKRTDGVENDDQSKELEEEEFRKVLDEKKSLEEKLDDVSSQLLSLTEKVEENKKEKEEWRSKHDTEILEIKSNYEKVLVEKRFLEKQQDELSSQISLLNEKVNEDEKEKAELSSKHATEILEIKSNYEKVMVEKRFLENQQSELTSQISLLKDKLNEKKKENVDEKAELNSKHETEILKIKAVHDKEVAALKSDLEQRSLTIADFEKSSRVRELEIANLILHSPLPTENESVEREFEFDEKPKERIKRLEIEIVKYKRKITELEDEAEDRFETALQLSEVEEKTLVEKIEKACKAKVEIITTKLETTTQTLNQQTILNQELEEKLRKMEIELENKSKEYIELSKLNKHLDINHNVLHTAKAEKGMFVNDVDQEYLTKEQKESTEKDEVTILEYEKVLKENERFNIEISKKDSELSTLIKEKDKVEHFIQSLKEELGNREEKYEHLTARAMKQKSNYESEIQLMQKEIGELIQENKDHGMKAKLAEKYQQENLKLQMKVEEMETDMAENSAKHQMKIEEMETDMAENSAKHQQEIQELKTIIQSKENSSKDLKKMYQALETSNNEIEINIENLRNQFDEKERELLNEMQEKTAMLEEEKNEILENSFHEKEELLTKISDLESLCKDSSLWLNSDEESKISKRTSNEYQRNTAGKFYSNHHSLSSPLFKEKALHTDNEGQLGIMDEHHWINRDKQRTMGDQLGYNERVDDIFGDHQEPQRENEGYSGNVSAKKVERYGWRDGVSEDNDGYEGIVEDKREQDSEYGTEMFGRYEERVGEYDYEEKEDEYEMGIELLIEKEEGEMLRKELGTMTRCVDVFHEECQRLKNSLDNTLDMLNMVKEERNTLLKESEQSLEEHSEIIMDLIKYEDVIKNLEKANEKLVKEKEMLQRCLLQTTDKPSSVEMLREHSTKTKADAEITFPRKMESVHECRSGKNNPDIQEIDFLMEELGKELKTSEVRENGEEEDRLQIMWDFQKERKQNRFPRSKPSTRDFAPQQKERERNEERKTMQQQTSRYSKNDSSFLQNGFPKWESDSWKPSSLSERTTREENRDYSLGEEVEKPKENGLFLELNSEKERAGYVYRSEEDGTKPKQYPEIRESNTRKHVAFTSDDAMPDEYMGTMTRGNKKAEQASRRPHPSKSTRAQRVFSEKTLHQRNHSKKDAQNVAKGKKISVSSSRQLSSNTTTTPFTSNSQNSKNASSGSSSFLTSTKTGSDLKLRLVPNLSGVSPIVSQFDRRRHNEMLKWRIADDLSSDVTQNTTFLTTADPFDGRPTQTVPINERSHRKLTNSSLTKKHKPHTMTPRHTRSISADDRLINSTNKAPSLNWPEESYLEKPLTINFEDFVFRHRVKSSEDVANLRDPSPAELWFS